MGKWRFNPNLEYQQEAINAVVNLFEGQEKIEEDNIIRYYRNELTIPFSRLEENMIAIQKNPINNVGYYDDNIFPDKKFTIEMETGTGKTYVYLRTILELYVKYGFSKFIIVVPSIAIRLGVEKTIYQLAEHFRALYDGIDLRQCFFVYDSKKTIHKLDSFSQLGGLNIVLMNYQTFDKTTNKIKVGKEDGKVYWDILKNTNPIVIVDEPQKIIGDKKKSKALKSIEDLKPLATFLYSATHTNYYNLLYRLDSFRAFKMHLVKSIKVSTIFSNIDKNFPYFRYVKFNDSNCSATVEVLCAEGSYVKLKQVIIKSPCSLYELTGLEQYKDFQILKAPHKSEGLTTNFYKSTTFENHSFLEGENNYDIYGDAIIRLQMRITIKKHLDKQLELLKENIKVLSLFFIDEVVKYRDYTKPNAKGIYAEIFEEVYDEVIHSDLRYLYLLDDIPTLSDCTKVHEGYFAIDKNQKVITNEKNYETKSEKTAEDIQRGIQKILDGKEELIQLNEPISFIFAHSALSEGWDNPNIFQLCLLRQTKSEIRKKQEIGRGLRLARGSGENNDIRREEYINELTVIASESYEEFAKSLQDEFNENNNYNKEAFTIEEAHQVQDMIESKADIILPEDFYKNLYNELKAGGFVKGKESLIQTNKMKTLEDYIFEAPILNQNRDRIVSNIIEIMNEKQSRRIEIVNADIELTNYFEDYTNNNIFKERIKRIEYITSLKTRFNIVYNEKELLDSIILQMRDEIKAAEHEAVLKTGILEATDKRLGARIVEQKGEEEKYKLKEKIHVLKSYTEIITYIMNKTNFTKEAILTIIRALSFPEILQRQENVDKLIKIITGQKIKQCNKYREKITYNKSDKTQKVDSNSLFLTINSFEQSKIQKQEVFMANSNNQRSICKYYKVDSKGEYEFAKCLDECPMVKLFSKIKKGSFVLENPVEAYTPDWVVVFENNNKEHFVFVETKWNKTIDDLSEKEKTKILCANKHFEAINTEFSYIWVSNWDEFKTYMINAN